MRQRLIFFAVTGFFIGMNLLLWRSEYGDSARFGASLPTDVVWEKVLTSPDDSWMEVRHRGAKIGRAHWRARLSEEVPEFDPEDPLGELSPEGMVQTVTGYSLDFSGNVALDELTRLRFDLGLELDARQAWKELTIKLVVKPFSLEVFASAQEEAVRLVAVEDDQRKEWTYKLADLRDPARLMKDLGGPMLPAALGALMGPLRAEAAAGGPGLVWEARNDRLMVGRTELRVYRLEARLLERFRAVFLVSPVGELLRVEFPGDLVMINDALVSF